MKIVIAGAGIGGLTAALVLHGLLYPAVASSRPAHGGGREAGGYADRRP
jgi:hypothetical protein